jgi:YaiO family outer membrane protein
LTEDESVLSIAKKSGVMDRCIKRLNPAGEIFKAGSRVIIGYLKIRNDQLNVLNGLKDKQPEEKQLFKKDTAIAKATDTALIDLTDFDSDKLFRQARHLVFNEKDYNRGIQICNMALARSPTYSDIRIFKGRIFTWMDKLDSAREAFNYVLQNDAENKELYIAYTDLEHWNGQYKDGLEICEKGLAYFATSSELMIRKVKLLKALNRSAEAKKVLDDLVKIDRTNTEIRALSQRNKEAGFKNKAGISYDYTYFDKQFDDPWHIASLDYSRQTKLGTVAAHILYANRFATSGLQYELEAYPNISKRLYSYVSAAYSNKVGVFPKYRAGFSLYGVLPKSMEGELGLRYLYFSSPTIVYTAALSKYYKSWLFTGRTYISFGDRNFSQSYNLVSRYYYGGADDYFSFMLGRGLSPDDNPQVVLLNRQLEKLTTVRAAVGYRHEFNKRYVLTLDATWLNQEYRPKTKGNQISTGVTYQVRF